jgi:arylsulfatase A-like enzyme
MKRRKFLMVSLFSILAMETVSQDKNMTLSQKPNILLIITDQQFADAMSCRIGKKYINTPALDSLFNNGIFYSRAYCANPVCVPSRSSMYTGRYPQETGVLSHEVKTLNNERFPCMGIIFKNAGYETGFVGKWHSPIPIENVSVSGFEYINNVRNNGADLKNSDAAITFLKQKRNSPFFLYVSYNNPHNICEWARGTRGNKLPDGDIGGPPPMDKYPPLPNNHNPPENETDIMILMRKSYQASKTFPVGNFGEKEWREYIWAYYRMIELVDKRISKLLDALHDANLEDNTIIFFTSDHGDCHGAHKWNQKTVFYDESVRVPFIISYKDLPKAYVSDRLVHTGVDLLPTLCDYAGIQIPENLPGLSLKNNANKARKYIVCQNMFLQGAEIDGRKPTPTGRMVRSSIYKYCLYSEGKRRESLVDMIKDPGEMVNHAGNPDFKVILKQHRIYLKEFAEQYNDEKAILMLKNIE